MKSTFLTILISFICLAAFAQGNAPLVQGKEFPIHHEKRELKHECGGKHHDFRKRHHRHNQDGLKHPNRLPNHRPLR